MIPPAPPDGGAERLPWWVGSAFSELPIIVGQGRLATLAAEYRGGPGGIMPPGGVWGGAPHFLIPHGGPGGGNAHKGGYEDQGQGGLPGDEPDFHEQGRKIQHVAHLHVNKT